MQIRKIGHCCMIIETNGKRIMTDPGGWTEAEPADFDNIDILLITHEHADHLHAESIATIVAKNPNLTIITNSSVGKILTGQNVQFQTLENTQSNSFDGLMIEAYGEWHKEIYNEVGMVANTGYFIDNSFFYPGDALTVINKKVDILALPVAGPWLDIKDAIDYAKTMKPRLAFPVHDGMLKHYGPFHKLPELTLTPEGIEFRVPDESGKVELDN